MCDITDCDVCMIRNEDVEQVLIGIPKDHKHVRVCLKLKNKQVLIFQEATIANILRGYITVKTHPTIKSQKLSLKALPKTERKEGFAVYQLLESRIQDEEVEEEISQLVKEARRL